jgi:serine protease AprX
MASMKQYFRLGLSGLLGMMLVLLVTSVSQGVTPPIDPAALGKIDRWVIDHTSNGQTAEFLVILNDHADLSTADRLTTKAAKSRYVYDTLYSTAQRSQKSIVTWLQQRGVSYRSFYIVNAIWVQADRETALALAARSDVKRLDGNPVIHNDLPEPAHPLGPQPAQPSGIEPGIQSVNAPAVWAQGFTGQGLVIGGQDTGYMWSHPALQPHYRGWNGITVTHDSNWHDSIHAAPSLGSCGVNSPVPCDDYGHGTHTMGTVVGSDGGANQIGMAPGAQWIGCRNMDSAGNGTPATYIECFEFFLAPYPVGGTPAQGDPSKAPDVTNNSWSCPPSEGCNTLSLLAAVQAQQAAGILTVVSATNSGPGCSSISDPPAIYAEAYTVGALNTGTDTAADFSSRGPVISDGSNRRKPDIAAPGTNTRSSTRDGGYGSMSGTSMAAPHVAGAVALLWSARPELKNQITLTEQLLNSSAGPIWSTACNSTGWPNNTFGYGQLDIQAALYDVTLSDELGQSAFLGREVTYTLHVTNTGIITDSYAINLDPGNWSVTTAFTSTDWLAPNESAAFMVNAQIPTNTSVGAQDTFTVTVASQTKSQRWASSQLTTSVTGWRVLLPVIYAP